jgi:hypothetical protein
MASLSHRQRNPATPPIARQKHPLATTTALLIAIGLFMFIVTLRVLF